MIIYKATNKNNGKSYIGLTKNTLNERRYAHYREARAGSEFPFHRALRVHSEDSWDWTVLTECQTTKEASDLEIRYIKEYNTFGSGYNGNSGGLREFTHQRTVSDIENLISVGILDVNINTPTTLKKPKSKKHREAISKSRKKFYSSERGKLQKIKQAEKMKTFFNTEEGKQHLQNLKNGVAKHEQRRAVRDIAKRQAIVEEYRSGTRIAELARKYRVSRTTIRRYINEFSR